MVKHEVTRTERYFIDWTALVIDYSPSDTGFLRLMMSFKKSQNYKSAYNLDVGPLDLLFLKSVTKIHTEAPFSRWPRWLNSDVKATPNRKRQN